MTPELLNFLEKNFFLFLFIFFRFLFLFFLFPLFASPFFPSKVKIALALVLALSFTPFLSFKITPPQNLLTLLPMLFSDFFFIFLISLFFRFLLGGLQLGGELVGLQMGFGISQTFDPLGGVSMPILSQFIYLLFILFFFTFNLHHPLIYFIVKSFYEIPPGSFTYKSSLMEILLKKSALIFDIAIKVLTPLLVFMLLINIVLAIIGRIIPQINILFVSLPFTLGIGLFFFGLMLMLLPYFFKGVFNEFTNFLGIFFVK